METALGLFFLVIFVAFSVRALIRRGKPRPPYDGPVNDDTGGGGGKRK